MGLAPIARSGYYIAAFETDRGENFFNGLVGPCMKFCSRFVLQRMRNIDRRGVKNPLAISPKVQQKHSNFRPLWQFPTGTHKVTRVAVRIVLQIVLMLGFGLPEIAGGGDFRNHLAGPQM